MNIKKGAFRLWVAITVLWISFIGWNSLDVIATSFRRGCWTEDGIWGTYDHMSWHDLCSAPQGVYPSQFVPPLIEHAVALPGGILVLWFFGVWILSGFQRAAHPAE